MYLVVVGFCETLPIPVVNKIFSFYLHMNSYKADRGEQGVFVDQQNLRCESPRTCA